MIYLTQFQIEQHYGASEATGGARRANADSCTRHQIGAYKYEFGYIKKYCCYAIIQKQGSQISTVERQGFLALNGKGEWKVLEGKEPEKDRRITFQFTPPKEEVAFPSPLFASHQLQRSQLVIYYPKWQADLAEIEGHPL